jgi:hypothetical protein
MSKPTRWQKAEPATRTLLVPDAAARALAGFYV